MKWVGGAVRDGDIVDVRGRHQRYRTSTTSPSRTDHGDPSDRPACVKMAVWLRPAVGLRRGRQWDRGKSFGSRLRRPLRGLSPVPLWVGENYSTRTTRGVRHNSESVRPAGSGVILPRHAILPAGRSSAIGTRVPPPKGGLTNSPAGSARGARSSRDQASRPGPREQLNRELTAAEHEPHLFSNAHQ
jgi:hypothetical protein